MTWMRQWRAGDVLKLLAVVLPALLFVGLGLGWIVQEYRRQSGERATTRATTAAKKFRNAVNEKTARAAVGPHVETNEVPTRKLGRRWDRVKLEREQKLKECLSAFAARSDGATPLFPSAKAAFLWRRGSFAWATTNLVGDCACLTRNSWSPFKSSLRNRQLGEEDDVGWEPLRDLGADSDELVVWARSKPNNCWCGLVMGPPEDEGLPLWTVYVAAAGIFVGAGMLLLAVGVSLVVAIIRARGEMERRNTFVSNAAHEVKTPLASILMRAERLADGAYATEERRMKAVSVILEQGRELRRRIERLRDFDRLERGMRTYERQSFDLGEAVRETARPLEERFEEHGLDLTGVASVQMVGDRDSVMEIVENLLTNAAKYAAHAGPVAVRVARAGNGAEVCVSDSGPGLPGAELRHVFDRDWRAHNDLTKSVGGWGVGLSFARDLARDMGGELSAAACPDGGCAFTLSLPLGAEIEEEEKS